MKTVLEIVEEVRYRVAFEGTPKEAMKEFLRNPNKYLVAVDERTVYVDEPKLTFEQRIDAQEEIAEAEMEA